MKIILDTNTVISSIIFDNKIEDLLKIVISNININIYFSVHTWEELSTKFRSSKIEKLLQKSKRTISSKQIILYLRHIKSNSITILEINNKVTICRDKKDNMFLELAKEVQANYLITGDKDLLVLKNFENTKILKPSEFLELL